MYITQETDYAIRIVYCLAKSGARRDARSISEEMCISLRFALKILGKLAQGGLVSSFKGNRGGYELARKGVEFEIAPKKVVIDEFRLAEQTAPDEYEFTIVCGGGTYVRALVRDLAAALGTQGYMTYLRRDASGVFTAETAVPLEALTPENVRGYLIPTETVLPFPVLDCADERIFHGVTVPVAAEDGVYKLYRGGEFYGLARAEGGFARAEKKLC